MADSNPGQQGGAPTADTAATDLGRSSLIGRVIGGDFQVRREIGRGGMGTVYEAWQLSLDRKVALKALTQALGLTGSAVVRFQREAQAAAKLHHANIVQIYAQGEQDGVYFYAMEFVEGRNLHDIIEERRGNGHRKDLGLTETKLILGSDSGASLSPSGLDETVVLPSRATAADDSRAEAPPAPLSESTVEYFDHIATHMAAVADALEYAHSEGVIHRDIKPHNFIFGKDGRMYVTDFGLARVLAQPGVTTTGEFVGSPLYMSPEQITGGQTPVDHRTDIYSLGATMYEWLTGSPPYPGETREQVISKILSAEPAAPRAINPAIPMDLETVCLKAINRDSSARYQSAGAMADDLRAFLRRGRIRARREGPLKRASKSIARNRGSYIAGALAVLVAVSALIASLTMRHSFERERAEQTQHLAEVQGTVEQLQSERDALKEEVEQKQQFLADIEALGQRGRNPLEYFPQLGQWLSESAEAATAAPNPEKPPEPAAIVALDAPPIMADEDRKVIALLVTDLAEPLRRAADAAPPVDELDGAEAEAERYYRQALRAEDPDVALGLVEKALEHNGLHFDALYLRTILRAVKGEFEHVGPDAKQTLLSFESESPAGHIMSGLGRLCTGEPVASITDFDQALELGPRRPAYVLMFRGLAKLFAGDFEASRTDLDRAVELEPENASLLVGLGLYEALRGNFIQAQDTFEDAVEIAPEHVAAQLERGRIRNRVQRQLEQYSAVLESDPDNAVAWERRGDAHALLGDLARAESDYAKAYEVYDSKPARLFAKRGLCKLNQESAGTGSRDVPDPRQPTSFPDWLRPVIP